MEAARPVVAADGPRVVELRRQAADGLASQRGGRLLSAERTQRTAPALVVGTLDGVVVGYGSAWINHVGEDNVLGVIDEVYVEPGARGVGVGEAILTALADRLTAAGCTGLDGTALPGDRQAKGFFERHGFTARLLVMHRPLTPRSGEGRSGEGRGQVPR
jgi:ribosomal protein S18 acetylase RimI-like enzyme